jgi:hypothetical protein
MEVIRMSERIEGAGPASEETDWREEFECERCREWQGTPPVRISDVERHFRAALPEGTEFTVAHRCYLCTDAQGTVHHVPCTVLSWRDREYTWLPENPAAEARAERRG